MVAHLLPAQKRDERRIDGTVEQEGRGAGEDRSDERRRSRGGTAGGGVGSVSADLLLRDRDHDPVPVGTDECRHCFGKGVTSA